MVGYFEPTILWRKLLLQCPWILRWNWYAWSLSGIDIHNITFVGLSSVFCRVTCPKMCVMWCVWYLITCSGSFCLKQTFFILSVHCWAKPFSEGLEIGKKICRLVCIPLHRKTKKWNERWDYWFDWFYIFR